ncbi:MAG: M23 family metallopeptidase [Acidobacteria bacterium]|nr:M23 family metallopeptidase [Acidobacteriota bacterium]
MPLRLLRFPIETPFANAVCFHDDFFDLRRGRDHIAIDVGALEGAPVCSTTGGRVLTSWMSGEGSRTGAGWSEPGGNVVAILDNNGFVHYYAHMLQLPVVRSGETVHAGKRLGYVSNTGSIARGSSPHLHYQVWPLGGSRTEEQESGIFTRRFAPAINPYDELARLVVALGVRVGSNSSVSFPKSTP